MKTLKAIISLALVATATMVLNRQSLFAADVTGDRANIGANHVLTGNSSTITGGGANTNKATFSVIAGGANNMIETNDNQFSTISGGSENIIFEESYWSAISGGALIKLATTRLARSSRGVSKQN